MNLLKKQSVTGKNTSLVLLLHGYGSNAQDLFSLAPYWAQELSDTVFVAMDAPFPCEIGFGFQWFSLASWLPQALLGGAERASTHLDAAIDHLLDEYKIPSSQLALVGFSQGTMMSLYKAPRRSKPLACVLGYSGALLGGEGLSNNSAIQKCPIHLIHGDFDMVVPVASYYQAMSVLQQAGFSVTGSVTQGLSHSIDEAGLKEGLNFLKRFLYEAT